MASDTEITKVRIVIRHLLWQIREVRKDRDAAWKWVNRFANTLQYQDLEQDPDQYALAILAEARSFNDQKKRNQQMRWVREQLAKEGVTSPTQEQLYEKWLEMYGQENSPQDAPNGNAGVDMYDAGNGAASKSPTSCDQFTADGDIREDSQAKPDGSAITRNETRAHDALEPSANQFTADASTREGEDELDHRGNTGTMESSTSANHYGDAATREGAEVVNSRESGAFAPTTVSRNMRRVPQNEAPAHGFSGGRTAQGTMSRSPEAAAQSGKDSAKTRDTRDDSRGRYAPPSCSPEDGNPAETAPSHGGSVASLEARQVQALESQRRTGGHSLRVGNVARPPVRSAGPMPENKQAVYDFAAAEGLDTADAYECWHVTVNERGGLTADGKPIKNWKAYVSKWCETRATRRNQ